MSHDSILKSLESRMGELMLERVPMDASRQPTPTPADHTALTEHVYRQTRGGKVCAVNSWVQRREAEYFSLCPAWPMELFTYAACRDLACAWFGCDEQEALHQIRILNHGAA
jgi:hypothetical protein